MGTIEQAAKRLEQLKQSGLEIDTGLSERHAQQGADASVEPLPLRVARELEARQHDSPRPAGGDSEIGVQTPGVTSAAESLEPAASGSAVRTAAGVAARHASPAVAAPAFEESGPNVAIDLARLSANGYVTPHAPRSRLAEEFRVVKRPLLTNARGKSAAAVLNANRIMITSATPGEGKTYVSVNLAISLAMELDTQVLLVDADTTRPAVLERLGLAPARGLLDLLVDRSLPPESLVLSTNVERLSILPSGTPQEHATELISSEGMGRLVQQLCAEDPRRIVLFDSPPLLGASESRVLAAHMGQVIVVVAADDTPQGTLAEALATVENCPVVMTLLNRVTQGERGHYYGSYSSHAH
ncbi:MAG TPA: AAA family ATPase [Burkholderiaceae bacterium]|nr:AAA family ATPase [Burkholderiaceae bacterium]